MAEKPTGRKPGSHTTSTPTKSRGCSPRDHEDVEQDKPQAKQALVEWPWQGWERGWRVDMSVIREDFVSGFGCEFWGLAALQAHGGAADRALTGRSLGQRDRADTRRVRGTIW